MGRGRGAAAYATFRNMVALSRQNMYKMLSYRRETALQGAL